MMTTKIATPWQPQPISSGPQNSITVATANNLVDQLGNALITGTNIPQAKIPIVWANTGV